MKDITYIIDITAGQPERMQEMKEQADAYILRGLLRAVEPPEGGTE